MNKIIVNSSGSTAEREHSTYFEVEKRNGRLNYNVYRTTYCTTILHINIISDSSKRKEKKYEHEGNVLYI